MNPRDAHKEKHFLELAIDIKFGIKKLEKEMEKKSELKTLRALTPLPKK